MNAGWMNSFGLGLVALATVACFGHIGCVAEPASTSQSGGSFLERDDGTSLADVREAGAGSR